MKNSADCFRLCIVTVGLALLGTACGKSSTPSTGGGGTSCTTSSLKIAFSPMYSAFDGTHHFQIPALVEAVDPSTVTWSASDSSMVAIAPDATTGGAMITTQKAGTVNIIATAGTLCGTSALNITSATSDDWEAGSARYNDGVVLTTVPRGGNRDAGPADAGADASSPREAACTNCHGDTATMLQFKTVQHTPEQTGGFSDEQLKNIFMNGMVPMGGYFDTTIVSYQQWQSFHRWQMSDDQARGIIVYLRSLTPTKQTGASNFGGRFDGGARDGGGREGGGREAGGREAGNGNGGGTGGSNGDGGDAAAD